MSELEEIYQWISEEYGKPLVVYPQGFGRQHAKVNKNELDCYWVVIDGVEGRHIRWVISGLKDIHEAEGPAALNCPLFFFELVPVVNSYWRDKVVQYWKSHG